MDFHIESLLEKQITKKADSFIGNKDEDLNTIYKMSLLQEVGLICDDDVNAVTEQIAKANEIQKKYINDEYLMTLDKNGNLVYINEGKTSKENPEIIVSESERSKEQS
jgi:hypothetical protein